MISLIPSPQYFPSMKTCVLAVWMLVCVLAVVSLAGCDRVEPEVDPPDNGRLVLGESVDGVRLGADTTAVFDILGMPSNALRGAGTVRYFYERGRHSGIEIYYDVRADGSLSQTSAITLTDSYTGTTEDGIGLGSPRDQVIELLGEPVSSVRIPGGDRHDRYFMQGNHLLFVYHEGEIISIGMAGKS